MEKEGIREGERDLVLERAPIEVHAFSALLPSDITHAPRWEARSSL